MLRTAILFGFVLVLATSSVGLASAQEPGSSPIVATDEAWDALEFDNAIESGEFLFLFGEPDIRNRIPFAVMNDSDETVDFPRFAVTGYEDGHEAVDESAWVYPLHIAPNEFGFGVADFGLLFPDEDGGFEIELLPQADNARDVHDLNVSGASSSGGGRLSGAILNPTNDDVHKIEVQALCLEDSGIITHYGSDILDRRLLAAGEESDFETRLPDDCGELFFVTAIAQVRD